MPYESGRPRHPIDLYVDCVVLTSFLSEIAFLRNVCKVSGIRIRHAESLDEADFLLTVTGSTVLLSDVTFAGGTWKDSLKLLHESHSLVTMLVIADAVDRPFLSDLFDRGACGVIWKPFQFDALTRQIRDVHEASKERRAWQEEMLSASNRPGKLSYIS